MNVVNRLVSYARIDLSDIYELRGVVSKNEIEESVTAAQSHTETRLKLEISEAQVLEATQILEGIFNVHVGAEAVLVNDEDHEEWLQQKKSDISWEFWERYKRWLIEDEFRAESHIRDSLDPVTDRILGMLEDPLRVGKWSRRGLVAGQVQSGKTSNYVGLINKAIDAGYKLIVVLAGTHDNLRSQTQARINSGVLGFNTEGNFNGKHGQRIGVGLKSPMKPRINCPTSSAQKGDFNIRLAKGVGALGGDPIILVIKKHTSILANLHSWATEMHHEIDPISKRKVVRDVPLLIIDDEADYASVDTGSLKDKTTGAEADPSATNKLIRQMLEAFEKSAYVGYTATPFANIFINPSADHNVFGRDLFPDHFIVTLPETSDYSGASRIFGVKADDAEGIEEIEPLPTTRQVSDYEAWLPDGHKKTDLPVEPLPHSLRTAIGSFVLASALKRHRRVRMKHNSMLVHVTRFIDVQAEVQTQILDLVEAMRREVVFLEAKDPTSGHWQSLRELYEADFVPTGLAMARIPDIKEQVGLNPSFVELEFWIREILVAVKVERVNGEARDSLQYDEHPDGLTVIAVGGDKLSRGLTLEGLTTSYYLRASKMYDTLMQMGRWFGFRPGYLDVCRLYTTDQLVRWYVRITAASERLYKEFELMAALGKTPSEFGLRVQSHPDGLMVTAANKSRFAKSVRASFSGTISETIIFSSGKASRQNNWAATERLFEALVTDPEVVKVSADKLYWRDVSPLTVLNFLDSYDANKGALRALPTAMAEYIRKCLALEDPQLTTWDVLIASKIGRPGIEGKNDIANLPGGTPVGLLERRGTSRGEGSNETFVTKRLVSSGDELLPLEGDARAYGEALLLAQDNWKNSTRAKRRENPPTKPSAMSERRVRSSSRGYLMLYPLDRPASQIDSDSVPYVGFAIAFPWSAEAPAVNYQVNEVYWDLQMNDVGEEIEDD